MPKPLPKTTLAKMALTRSKSALPKAYRQPNESKRKVGDEPLERLTGSFQIMYRNTDWYTTGRHAIQHV